MSAEVVKFTTFQIERGQPCPRCGTHAPLTDWHDHDTGIGVQTFNLEWGCPTHGDFRWQGDEAIFQDDAP